MIHHSLLRRVEVLIVVMALAVPAAAARGDASADPGQRRAAVRAAAEQGAEGIPRLVAALDDEDALVRRAAARALGEAGKPAREHQVAALDNADPLVRRLMVLALGRQAGDVSGHEAGDGPEDVSGPGVVELLASALGDEDPMVRQAVVQILIDVEPRTRTIHELLKLAREDDAPAVRDLAADALWPFHKQSRSVRESPDLDYNLQVARSIELPLGGWKFRTDPRQDGHLDEWFAADFDDGGWADIGIGKVWQAFGHEYTGVAWYRDTFTLPEEPADVLGVDLRFDGVDESAWVWINGQYIGQHDIGPAGWDVPFAIEVTDALKWGQENQITVRVLSVAHAGGIWKPVHIEALRR